MKRTYVLKELLVLFKIKSPNTITNWELREGFPKHKVIGNRSYWDADLVDQWYNNKFGIAQDKSSPAVTPRKTVNPVKWIG